jgi:hypothetical protein
VAVGGGLELNKGSCSEVQAVGCKAEAMGGLCLFPLVLQPTWAFLPGWRHRRSPSEAAAGPAVPAQVLLGASGRGPPAGTCGHHPGGLGGTGSQLPGGARPRRPRPAPSAVWPAGTHRGRPCEESGSECTGPISHPFYLPRSGLR